MMPDLNILAFIAALSAMVSVLCLTIAYHVPPDLRDGARDMIERIDDTLRGKRED